MGELKMNLYVQQEETKGFVPYRINEYLIGKPLTSNKSGFSKWGFCLKNGKEYFIKEFLTPVYPADEVKLSDEIRKNKIEQCCEWFENKKNIYAEIVKSQSGNLIIPLNFFKSGSHFYLVTEKVVSDNISFSSIKDRSDEQKLIIMKVLADSFIKLSERGIVHADLKPDNLIFKKTLSDFFTVKIIDFDASYLESNQPFGDEVQGDFVYFAPETFIAFCEGEAELTPKVDVFAMGIIFHQLLCGEMPEFSSEYDYIYEAVLNDDEIKLNESIPYLYRKIIEKMLIKDSEKRCSMKDVLSMLNGEKSDESEYSTGRKRECNQHRKNSRWKIVSDFD